MSKHKTFEKVKNPIKKHATVWRNKYAMDWKI
jgi:hypothetical protein